MPQAIFDISEWRETLGESWEEHHGMGLHRWVTLAAYDSTYFNRPFDEKEKMSRVVLVRVRCA